jgi:hypothetical protein
MAVTMRASNSGTMQYVRIEFAGWEISSGKEFNGLFLAGVGKGTTLRPHSDAPWF